MRQCVQVAEVWNVYVMLKASLEQIGPFLRLNFFVVHKNCDHNITLLGSHAKPQSREDLKAVFPFFFASWRLCVRLIVLIPLAVPQSVPDSVATPS